MRASALRLCLVGLVLGLALSALGLLGCAPNAVALGGQDLTAPARQLLLVVAEDWNYSEASLQRFERATFDSDWTPIGGPVPVSLGRKGLGWGRGLHGLALGAGPVKREGDGRAPADVFALGPGFAREPADVGVSRVPLLRADKSLVCVDDGASPLYNQFAQTSGGPVAWTSAEDMDRADGQYKLGMFVRHNVDPPVPGGGSCIFLHIWLSPGAATSGCTAMDEANLLALLRWLDAAKSPVLAQLPRTDYQRLRTALRLPQ